MLETMREQLDKRFKDLQQKSLVSQATLLDPRFKKQGFSDEKASEEAKDLLTTAVSEVFLENSTAEDTGPREISPPREAIASSSTTSASTSTFSIWEDYDKQTAGLVQADDALAAAVIEVNSYLQEPLLRRGENPLDWWKGRKNTYPRMFTLMKKTLCVTATSVPCERVFSKAGITITEKRTRLSANKVQQLLFINSNSSAV